MISVSDSLWRLVSLVVSAAIWQELTPDSITQEKFEKNGKKVEDHVRQLLLEASKNDGSSNILSSRIENPLGKFGAFVHGSGDKDGIYNHELSSFVGIRLPYTEKLPPYTTWIFLDRYDFLVTLVKALKPTCWCVYTHSLCHKCGQVYTLTS